MEFSHDHSEHETLTRQLRDLNEYNSEAERQQLDDYRILTQTNQNSYDPAGSRESATPPSRSFSSFIPIDNQKILLYGGVSSQNENLADCWLLDIKHNSWTQIDVKDNLPRLWHTGSYTKNREVIIIGGTSSDRPEEFCPEVITIALEPKSLKRLALDSVSSSVKLRTISKIRGIPVGLKELIKLRKRAMLQSLKGFSISHPTPL